MKEYVIRLTCGQELKSEIYSFCKNNNIDAGFIASAVGSLTQLTVRDAGGKDIHTLNDSFEIVSLTGTASNKRLHLHISLSKEDLSVS